MHFLKLASTFLLALSAQAQTTEEDNTCDDAARANCPEAPGECPGGGNLGYTAENPCCVSCLPPVVEVSNSTGTVNSTVSDNSTTTPTTPRSPGIYLPYSGYKSKCPPKAVDVSEVEAEVEVAEPHVDVIETYPTEPEVDDPVEQLNGSSLVTISIFGLVSSLVFVL